MCMLSVRDKVTNTLVSDGSRAIQKSGQLCLVHEVVVCSLVHWLNKRDARHLSAADDREIKWNAHMMTLKNERVLRPVLTGYSYDFRKLPGHQKRKQHYGCACDFKMQGDCQSWVNQPRNHSIVTFLVRVSLRRLRRSCIFSRDCLSSAAPIRWAARISRLVMSYFV